jgi:hypothetical protein
MMPFALSLFVLISLLVLVLIIIENRTCIWAVKPVREKR